MKPLPWQMNPTAYDFRYTLSPHYAHMDTLRHINNVAVHSFHVEARMRYQLAVLGRGSLFSDRLLLRPRRTVTNFIRETYYPDDVTCALKLVGLTADSYRFCLGLFQNDVCVGVQDCLMGAWEEDRWVDLPAPVHAALTGRIDGEVTLNGWPEPAAGVWGRGSDSRGVAVTARYVDMDPDRYLGELALARYVEQSRAGSVNMLRHPGFGLLVARVDIRHDCWSRGLGRIELPTGLSSIGNTSFALDSDVFVDDNCVAAARSVMVLMDRCENRPTAIAGSMREAMQDSLMVPVGDTSRTTAGD